MTTRVTSLALIAALIITLAWTAVEPLTRTLAHLTPMVQR